MADGAAMSRIDGPNPVKAPLADERRQVLEALDGDVLTGPAIAHRMDERPTETEAAPAATGGAHGSTSPGDQALLYPALYGLEANWQLQAGWLPDAQGGRHRTYRKRRLLPRRAGSEKAG
jgi:hypothetical protein